MATLPQEFKINRVAFVDNKSFVSADTRSLVYSQRNTTGQRFEFTLTSIKVPDTDIKKIIARLGAIKRNNELVSISLPIYSNSDATTKQTNAVGVIGVYSIELVSVNDIEIGDFFTFAGHTKAYQVDNITGNVIEFTPNLTRPVALLETLTFNNMQFTCHLVGRPQQYNMTADDTSTVVEIRLIEAT